MFMRLLPVSLSLYSHPGTDAPRRAVSMACEKEQPICEWKDSDVLRAFPDRHT
jgi:hypothetical protein